MKKVRGHKELLYKTAAEEGIAKGYEAEKQKNHERKKSSCSVEHLLFRYCQGRFAACT